MMKTDHTDYPPRLADDVQITEQRDGARAAFVIGSASAGCYILVRETEYRVLRLLGRSLTLSEICHEFKREQGRTLTRATLVKFLTRLNQVGILAGERAQGVARRDQQLAQFYLRFKLFNPDRLFARMVLPLRWIWTPQFVVGSLGLMTLALWLSVTNWVEVTSYTGHILGEHFLAVFAATWFVAVSHEFAHGLTCKAFGGRTPEVGALMIYYFLPALYCDVSGIHLIPQRGRRMWVIAAGIYWQLLVGTLALLAWFCIVPHTLLSDVTFILFLGSVLNIVFNANPLIKLDGYYFLGQWLREPNLMDRSRACWRVFWRQVLFGERELEVKGRGPRLRAIYFAFGFLSYCYTVTLICFIVIYVGGHLIDWFYLPGVLLTVGLALLYTRRPLKRLIVAGVMMVNVAKHRLHSRAKASALPLAKKGEGDMNTPTTARSAGDTAEPEQKPIRWRRRLVPLAILLLLGGGLLLPWEASVGNYGTLISASDQESIIRAPESATLIAIHVQPGQQVQPGAVVGYMGNLQLEEEIVQVQAELARAQADYDRLVGELRASGQSSVRAELQLGQRRRDYNEIHSEQLNIEIASRTERSTESRLLLASTQPIMPAAPDAPSGQPILRYPAAIAVLRAEVDARRAQLKEANSQRDRMRHLYAQGVLSRSEMDMAETRAATLSAELGAASERLEAAVIEHRRKHAVAATDLNLAQSDVGAGRIQVENLSGALNARRALIGSLEARRDLLHRRRAQFELTARCAGAVFGEELPRMAGRYFEKGSEICRVADTRQLLLRIQVPEREIGDVLVGRAVRLKARSYPDHIFKGVVSKIGGESEPDEYKQATYRVELTIENDEGLLRPGMTAFARIDFGRRMIGQIVLHKIKQALRPELWML